MNQEEGNEGALAAETNLRYMCTSIRIHFRAEIYMQYLSAIIGGKSEAMTSYI